MAGQEHDGDSVMLVTPDSAGGAARQVSRSAGILSSNFFSNLTRASFGRRPAQGKAQLNLTSIKARATAAQQLRPQAGKDEYEFTEEDDAPCQPRVATAPRSHAEPAAGRQHGVNATGLIAPPSTNTRYRRLHSEHERDNGAKARDTHLGHSVHIERDGQRTASTSGREEVTSVYHRVSAVPINGAVKEVTRALEGLRTPKAPTDRMQVDRAGQPNRKVPVIPYTRAHKAATPSSLSCVELTSEEEDVNEDEKQHVHTTPASRLELHQSERSVKAVSGRNFYGNNASPAPVSSNQHQTPELQESNRMAAPTVDIPERHPKKAKTMESPLTAMDLSNWQPALLKSDVVFPTNEPDAVTVTNADMERLAPSEFLNDTLIDFYIKYLQTNLPDSQRARIHFFNSFFYKKLTQADKDGQSGGTVGYARVRNWTRRIDIFTKDYIIVPINESLHWSVAVICHPGVASQASSSCTQRPSLPFIVHLDSMKGGHNKVDQYLCEYLAAAWEERAQQSRTTNPFPQIPVLRPKVPQQDNYSDCGLFLLYYVERFCKDIVASDAATVDQSAVNSLLEANWFLPEEASAMRWELQHVLLCLDAQRHNMEPPSSPVIRKVLQEFKLQAAQEREAAATRAEAAVDLVTPPPTAADDLACQDGFQNLSLNAEEEVKTLPYGPSVCKQSPGTPPGEQEQHMEVLHPITNLTRELGEAEIEAEERPSSQLQQMRDRCIAAICPSIQSQVEKLQRLLPVKDAQQGVVLEQPGSSERLPEKQAAARSHADGSKVIVVNSDDEGSAVPIQRSYPLRSKGKLESMRQRQTQSQFDL
eukprot:jgi/Chlat1/5966/Chrsp4S06179